jgi:hypothetical protein
MPPARDTDFVACSRKRSLSEYIGGEGVGIGGRELVFAEAADGVEHIQRPAPKAFGALVSPSGLTRRK